MRRWLIEHAPDFLHPGLRALERGGTSAIGGILTRLPGTSSRIGPPRGFVPSLRARSRYTEIHPGHWLTRTPPSTLDPAPHPAFLRDFSRFSPSAGVGVIEHGRVLSAMGAVITPDDKLVFDVSHTGGSDDPRAHPIFSRLRMPALSAMAGSVAVLTTYATRVGGHSYYYHWIMDTLPRLALLREAKSGWDRVVAPQDTAYQTTTLQLLGVAPEKIISAPGLYIEAEELIVPTLPGVVGNPPKWACEFLRNSFLPRAPARPGRKRLYLSRSKAATRHVVNEDELMQSLRRRGFELVHLEDLSFLDQVGLMRSAEMVVAPHGTGLTNLVFCDPGTIVLEIFSPAYVTACYYAAAHQLGLNYGYVLGQGELKEAHRVHEDITVDVGRVNMMLDSMGGDARPSTKRMPAAGAVGVSPRHASGSSTVRSPSVG